MVVDWPKSWLGADGDRLAKELDHTPIVLDPEPPPAPRPPPLLAFKLLPARRLVVVFLHHCRQARLWAGFLYTRRLVSHIRPSCWGGGGVVVLLSAPVLQFGKAQRQRQRQRKGEAVRPRCCSGRRECHGAASVRAPGARPRHVSRTCRWRPGRRAQAPAEGRRSKSHVTHIYMTRM
jgi:hypothetical protein